MKTMTFKRIMLLTVLLAVTLSAVTGGTIAWFTDEVTSAQNTIQTGNLDMELEYSHDMTTTSWTPVKDTSDLFKQDALWEPGHTEYVYLRLTNKGNLAAKYQLSINYKDTVKGTNVDDNEFALSDSLSFGVADDITAAFQSRDEARAAVPNAQPLDEYTFIDSMTAQNQQKTMALVVFMPETVGNEANHKTGTPAPKVDLKIKLVATQMASESDAFDNQYDADANPPSANKLGDVPLTLDKDFVQVTIPANALNGQYSLELANVTTEKQEGGKEKLSGEVKLLLNGKPVEPDNNVIYNIALNDVGYFLQGIKIEWDGNTVPTKDKNYESGNYAGDNDDFKFQSTAVGSFAITYEPMTEGLKMTAAGKITDGIFKEINPALYDITLDDDKSEYIAVSYIKDQKDHFAVGARATTRIIANAGTTYTPVNNNHAITHFSNGGDLWSIIRDLQTNDYSHVFILPGTYTCATTIGVYSSMEIAGLGDVEDVKIVKGTSSGSNRHLINASNSSKPEYIEVIVRDLTLDVPVNNVNKKGKAEDNAAVQSIRKTKVKCYNLIINKSAESAGWERAAFYANGTNTHADGKIYPGYLYAENITMTATPSMSVVSTSGSSKFFYDGVTNDGKTYTYENTYQKNTTMAYDDWTWD